MEIDWSQITDGYAGFELLATQYVSDMHQYPGHTWRQTSQTRDGNKDAYTVIIGYQPHSDPRETWWMEAKYTSTSPGEPSKYLTRFRLDATIVSSIFQSRVSKVIFVTNIEVHSKTISDIRIALQKAIGCNDVYFATKHVLEYWLAKNPTVYSQFFPGEPPQVRQLETLFVSENIAIYLYPSNQGYIEKCAYVIRDKTYLAYFKLISSYARDVNLQSAQNGIIIEDSKISLDSGETAIRVRFRLTQDFAPMSQGKDGQIHWNLTLFQIGSTCPVMLHTCPQILENKSVKLSIRAQTIFLTQAASDIQTFRSNLVTQVSIIHGESGVGKSHLLHELFSQTDTSYYFNFSEDCVENAKQMLYLVFFLLFPYVNPEDVDISYLNEISETTMISKEILWLAEKMTDANRIEGSFEEFHNRCGSLFPQVCKWNPRYVYLDNLQRLSASCFTFLSDILKELNRKHCPVYVLMAGQSYIMENPIVASMKQSYPVSIYECVIDPEDITNNLQAETGLDLSDYSEVIGDYFPNLIILLQFIKYLRDTVTEIPISLDSFLTLYFSFVNGNLGEALVLAQFQNVQADAKQKQLCTEVYTAPRGVPIEQAGSAAMALLRSGLVKLDEQNRMIPFHDIYERIYRRTYRIDKRQLGIPYADELDMGRDILLFSNNPNDILPLADKITTLRKEGSFRSVCYILGDYFDQPWITDRAGLLKRKSYTEIYYQMYFDYAYATVNCSHHQIGYNLFEKIYAEIKHKTSDKMRRLQLELQFEMMNSDYNILQFKSAMDHYRKFQEILTIIIRSGAQSESRIENKLYIWCENMRIQLQSSRGKKRSEQMFLLWRNMLLKHSYYAQYLDLNIRYAHTLYTIDINRAFLYTREAYNLLPKVAKEGSKLWALSEFQYLYLTFLKTRDPKLISQIEKSAESAKENYYSSYRHRNLAICGILYAHGDFQRADERFLRDMAQPRALRNKLKGFYYETLALHHLIHGQAEAAKDALSAAATVFQTAPSYLRVISHNQKVVNRQLFSPQRITFDLGKKREPDWYYIDPRAD